MHASWHTVLAESCRTCGNLLRVRIMACLAVGDMLCILCFWEPVSCLTRFFFGAFISVPDLLDMLCCGCTVFIPVSNGCFCTLICKRYAVMEESLIKRIALSIEEKTWQQRMITCDREWSFQLAVAVQIFVLLLLVWCSCFCSHDSIWLNSVYGSF